MHLLLRAASPWNFHTSVALPDVSHPPAVPLEEEPPNLGRLLFCSLPMALPVFQEHADSILSPCGHMEKKLQSLLDHGADKENGVQGGQYSDENPFRELGG